MKEGRKRKRRERNHGNVRRFLPASLLGERGEVLKEDGIASYER